MHEKYGPLVRIGPNEISFYSLEIYKTVHSIRSPFAKDPRVYGQFVQDAHPALFSITDPAEHSQRRRLMGQIFNQSKMGALEGMMITNIMAFVKTLEQQMPRAIEVIKACRALEADIVSDFAFGQEIRAVASWANCEDLEMVKANDEKSKIIALLSSFPLLASFWEQVETVIYRITGWQRSSTAALKQFDQWSSDQLDRLTSSKTSPENHPNFITTMIRSNLPASSALSEAKEMLGPGTDTTSATLAHIIWALAHDDLYQEALTQDLREAQWPTDLTSLEAIPRLRAAVKEGIRWTGAAAAMLPRVIPQGGFVLADKFIPSGTVISSSPIWYLHDKTAFPSPKLYRPSRWLNDEAKDSDAIKLRDDFYIPFSKGSSACIGAHFAYLELYLSVSQILKKFHLNLPRTSTFSVQNREARLPQRLEWVAAVPRIFRGTFVKGSLEVSMQATLDPWDTHAISEAALPQALAVLFGGEENTSRDIEDQVLLGRTEAVRSQCCAQFVVSRERVLQHSRDEYIALRQWLLDGSSGLEDNTFKRNRGAPADDRVAGRILSYVWHILFLGPGKPTAESWKSNGIYLDQLNNLACPRADKCYCRLSVEMEYPTVKKAYYETPSGQIHYRYLEASTKDATKSPIMFLHMTPISGRYYEPLMQRCASAGYDCFAPDMPGFGNSYDPTGNPSSITFYVETFLLLSKEKGLTKLHLVGHYTEASIATKWAALYPDMVLNITVSGPALYNEAEQESFKKTDLVMFNKPVVDGSHFTKTWEYSHTIGKLGGSSRIASLLPRGDESVQRTYSSIFLCFFARYGQVDGFGKVFSFGSHFKC
ncbi:hypothetical protein G7Y89_g3832 [Cudoniella acicularis]|uniref:AB hydrolase-1 domain-containing protein n=1 Tax=Cudoniella acicularis TaxID=354080 RepID=A0A8H4W5K2_9HELO|nr:hypothetical protein G7Y89_g3832 [Cudoniella acicularis]